MSNSRNTTVYIDVTNNLSRRIIEHKEGKGSLFCKKYNNINDAIAREKQLKNYSRNRKNELIFGFNDSWSDLFNEIWDW